MKIRKSQLKTIVEEVMTEAKAQFGGEVIDARDLSDKMQRKVSDIIGDMGLRSSPVIEDDLRGKFIYLIFKGAGAGKIDLGRLSNAKMAGADFMIASRRGQDLALALRQR